MYLELHTLYKMNIVGSAVSSSFRGLQGLSKALYWVWPTEIPVWGVDIHCLCLSILSATLSSAALTPSCPAPWFWLEPQSGLHICQELISYLLGFLSTPPVQIPLLVYHTHWSTLCADQDFYYHHSLLDHTRKMQNYCIYWFTLYWVLPLMYIQTVWGQGNCTHRVKQARDALLKMLLWTVLEVTLLRQSRQALGRRFIKGWHVRWKVLEESKGIGPQMGPPELVVQGSLGSGSYSSWKPSGPRKIQSCVIEVARSSQGEQEKECIFVVFWGKCHGKRGAGVLHSGRNIRFTWAEADSTAQLLRSLVLCPLTKNT